MIRDLSATVEGVVLPVVRHHKIAIGVGGGLVAVLGISALIERRRAAAVGEKIVEKLRSVLGTPYIWGGRDPSRGLDCSGAVVWALRDLGLKPRTWNASAEKLREESSAVFRPVAGDLAFYGGGLIGDVSHVMVYVGDGKVIGASGGGPSTDTLTEARVKDAKVKILPVHYRKDFRGYGRLRLGPLPEDSSPDYLVGADVGMRAVPRLRSEVLGGHGNASRPLVDCAPRGREMLRLADALSRFRLRYPRVSAGLGAGGIETRAQDARFFRGVPDRFEGFLVKKIVTGPVWMQLEEIERS